MAEPTNWANLFRTALEKNKYSPSTAPVEQLDKNIKEEVGKPVAKFTPLFKDTSGIVNGTVEKNLGGGTPSTSGNANDKQFQAALEHTRQQNAMEQSIRNKIIYSEVTSSDGSRLPVVGSAEGLIPVAKLGISGEPGRFALGIRGTDLTSEEQQYLIDKNQANAARQAAENQARDQMHQDVTAHVQGTDFSDLVNSGSK